MHMGTWAQGCHATPEDASVPFGSHVSKKKRVEMRLLMWIKKINSG